MGNADRWNTIDELLSLCEEEGYWTEDFLEKAVDEAKKSHIRKCIKQLKDSDGWDQWASVETQTAEGDTVRVYKQEALFDVEDYRQVVHYHNDRSDYHAKKAESYAARCQKRFNVQLTLPFEDRKAG
jgi:hypothetical protein